MCVCNNGSCIPVARAPICHFFSYLSGLGDDSVKLHVPHWLQSRSGVQEGKMKGPEERLSQGKEPEPEAVALARTLCSEGTRSEALR